MTQYDDTLAARTKAVVHLVHFVGPDKYFMNRDWSGRTAPDADTQLGLQLEGAYKLSHDPQASKVRQGALRLTLVDRAGTVTSWLESNETALAERQVDVYWGFTDTPQADFKKLIYFLRTYNAAKADMGDGDSAAWDLHLVDVFSLARKSLFEDLEDNRELTVVGVVGNGTTQLQLEEDASENDWPATGVVLLKDTDKKQVELVAYASLTADASGTTLDTLTRRYTGGTGQSGFLNKSYPEGRTRVKRVHVLRGHPLDLWRRLLTTTAGGGNGPHDAADGHGLGDVIPSAAINHTEIETARDTYAPAASGWDWLLILDRPITNVQRFAEEQLLRAAGFIPTLDDDGLLTVVPTFQFPPPATDLAGRFKPDEPLGWGRNYPDRENNLSYQYNWNPADREAGAAYDVQSAQAVADYKESKLLEIEARGVWGNAARWFGMPDLGGDTVAVIVGTLYLTEFAAPDATFNVRAFWALKDVQVGHAVKLVHPGLRVVGKATRGSDGTEAFLVTGKSLSLGERGGGVVSLDLRQRVTPFQRPFFVQNTGAAVYGSADDSELLRGYISPSGGGNFADGKPPYRWLVGPVGDGSLTAAQAYPWAAGKRDGDSPSIYNDLQGLLRERDRYGAEGSTPWLGSGSTINTTWTTLGSTELFLGRSVDTVLIYGRGRQNQNSDEAVEFRVQITDGVTTANGSAVLNVGALVWDNMALQVTVPSGLQGKRVTVNLQGQVIPDSPRDTPSAARFEAVGLAWAHLALD